MRPRQLPGRLDAAAPWVLAALLAACGRATAPESTGPTVLPTVAAQAIAGARCEREDRCRHVGPARQWLSASECIAKLRGDWNAALSERGCLHGVMATRLDECVTATKFEDCLGPFAAVAPLVACLPGHLCTAP